MYSLLSLFEQAQTLAEQHIPFSIAIVTGTRGSAPARAGSVMMVMNTGEVMGTIGGSDVEEKTRIQSLRCIQNHSTQKLTFKLSNKSSGGEDLACGGEVEIWAFPVFSQCNLPAGRIVQLIKQRKPFAICICLSSDHADVYAVDGEGYVSGSPEPGVSDFIKSQFSAILSGANSCVKFFRDNPVFFVRVRPLPYVLMCGGGHIHFELAKLLDNLGYFYAVYDKRPEFASKRRFPNARMNFNRLTDSDIYDFSHISIASHNQSVDFECVNLILRRGFKGYIGLIGSKSKHKDFARRLEAENVTGFDAVDCPMGIGIQTSTVTEIAFSIASKIIDTYNKDS